MPWIVTRDYIIDTEVGFIHCDVEMDITTDPVVVRMVRLDDTADILASIRDYIKNYLEDAEDGSKLRDEERMWAESQQAEHDREQDIVGEDEC